MTQETFFIRFEDYVNQYSIRLWRLRMCMSSQSFLKLYCLKAGDYNKAPLSYPVRVIFAEISRLRRSLMRKISKIIISSHLY